MIVSPLSPNSSSSWHGQLQLEFDRQDHKTLVRHCFAQAPLKVQRPFYPEGETICHSVMLHTAGGIVGGDRLSIQVKAHPNAQTLLTTAAATKVYRTNGREAQQRIQIAVAAGGCVEWLPQETIVFAGALYRQDLRVDLAVDAVWLGWDITRFGRSASGEKFASGDWRSKTEVWQGDRLVWIDPQRLIGGSEMLEHAHGLAGYPVVGSFAWVGRPVSAEVIDRARQLAVDPQFAAITQGDWGVTRLMSGLLCRYRGQSTTEVRRWFIQVWHLLRSTELGRSRCLPRVWQEHL